MRPRYSNEMTESRNPNRAGLRFFLSMRQNLFFYSGAGKFCLAYGLGQIIRDVKSGLDWFAFIAHCRSITLKSSLSNLSQSRRDITLFSCVLLFA